jgi:hypothetical protein
MPERAVRIRERDGDVDGTHEAAERRADDADLQGVPGEAVFRW